MLIRKLFLIIVFIGVLFQLHADDKIYIALSYKVILDPVTGQRPNWATDENIQIAVDEMNALLEPYWRGYRMQLAEIVEVGGTVSQWYDVNFFTCGNCKETMENEALDNQDVYAWNTEAINIYINESLTGGICSFPDDIFDVDQIIIIGADYSGDGSFTTS